MGLLVVLWQSLVRMQWQMTESQDGAVAQAPLQVSCPTSRSDQGELPGHVRLLKAFPAPLKISKDGDFSGQWRVRSGFCGVTPLVCSGKDINKQYGCNFEASSE